MPNNNTNTTIPDEFRTFLEWKEIVVDTFADFRSFPSSSLGNAY